MAIQDILADQAGVISLAQAVGAGMSAATVQRRVRTGEWLRLYPRIYLVGGHRLTDEARVRAAFLWAGTAEEVTGTSTVVTGPAAAYWHGMLDRVPGQIELTVPRRRHLRAQPGVTLRRRDLSVKDVDFTRRVRVADKPLAALETALALPDGSTFLDRALQKHMQFAAFHRAYCRTIGQHGATRRRG